MTNFDSKILDNVFVSIIILNYNGGQHILECIESLFQTVNCKKEIILIDNNSSDNSHIVCKEKFSEIILIQNKENIGMAARNIGLKMIKGNFIVFLDSDTIVEKNWLISLVISYKKNGEGLYQPKLLEKKRRDIINSCGNMINIFGLAYSRGKGEKDTGKYDEFSRISYTSGACTFSSSMVIQKIGFVDEVFFAYHDDVEYGWRASLFDIPSYYEPKSIVFHLGSPTLEWSSKKFFLLERNRWICLLTLYSRKTLAKIFPLLIIVEIGMFFFFLKKGLALTKLHSCFSLMKLHTNIKKKRDEIIKIRKLNDNETIKIFVDDYYLPSASPDLNKSKVFHFLIRLLSNLARKMINL
ncbi:MAG: glycosyltransferase family 2 protein [Nitrosopumilaceae archaeon]|nr:MAG: glycosyltransferase family 2 protein [Nitrosopumilaceae archaeon]